MSPLQLLKDTAAEWGRHKASMMAAALAYYTVFSLAPLMIIVITIVGLVVGQSSAKAQIMDQIKTQVGEGSATLIQTMVDNASKPADGLFATVIGIVTLLLGASGVFQQLKGALNIIWDYEPKTDQDAKKNILSQIRAQFLSFGMVLGVGFLLLVSLLLSAGLAAASQWIATTTSVNFPAGVWELINTVISFAVIAIMFAAIFKVLPDADVKWRDVWIGAAFTALLFTVGKLLIGLYLGHSGTSSAYGAAGSLVVILLWVFYSAQILFFGAEFTHVYAARRAGSPIPSAVIADEQAKAKTARVEAEKVLARAKRDAERAVPRPDRTVTTINVLHGVGQLALLGLTAFTQVQRLRGTSNKPTEKRR